MAEPTRTELVTSYKAFRQLVCNGFGLTRDVVLDAVLARIEGMVERFVKQHVAEALPQRVVEKVLRKHIEELVLRRWQITANSSLQFLPEGGVQFSITDKEPPK